MSSCLEMAGWGIQRHSDSILDWFYYCFDWYKIHGNKFHLCDNMNGGEKIKSLLFRTCFLECTDLIKKKQKQSSCKWGSSLVCVVVRDVFLYNGKDNYSTYQYWGWHQIVFIYVFSWCKREIRGGERWVMSSHKGQQLDTKQGVVVHGQCPDPYRPHQWFLISFMCCNFKPQREKERKDHTRSCVKLTSWRITEQKH